MANKQEGNNVRTRRGGRSQEEGQKGEGKYRKERNEICFLEYYGHLWQGEKKGQKRTTRRSNLDKPMLALSKM